MTIEELNPNNYLLTQLQAENLTKLCAALSELEKVMLRAFKVTSGLRTREDQLRINPQVKNSAHMYGEAADLLDVDNHIDYWCVDNLDVLIRLGLYLESPTYSPRWSHLQIRVPKSGNRIFIP